MIQLAPDMPTMKTTEFLWACMGDLTEQKIVFQLMVRNNKAVKLAEWIVCNSAYELEPAAFTMAPEILPIGRFRQAAGLETQHATSGHKTQLA
ncbi:hypothetical protein GBA52_028590 [Prunus armeniaca]|nr:hypothetical protein GBA52_028590 [Prunus armeniaca]